MKIHSCGSFKVILKGSTSVPVTGTLSSNQNKGTLKRKNLADEEFDLWGCPRTLYLTQNQLGARMDRLPTMTVRAVPA